MNLKIKRIINTMISICLDQIDYKITDRIKTLNHYRSIRLLALSHLIKDELQLEDIIKIQNRICLIKDDLKYLDETIDDYVNFHFSYQLPLA